MSDHIIFKKRFYKSIFVGSAVACTLLLWKTYLTSHRVKAKERPSTPLEELNKIFTEQYTKAANNYWNSAIKNGFIIKEKFRSISLFHNGTESEAQNSIPEMYHELKMFAHIPLATYFLIKNSSNLADDVLTNYLYQLNNLKAPDSFGLEVNQTIDRIISESKNILGKETGEKGSVDSKMLKNFCQNLNKDLSTLLNMAATAHLNRLHEIVQHWKEQYNFNPQDPSVKVLLIGPRSNRDKNLQTTYFERLLNDKERERIVYIEELFKDEEKAQLIFSKWFLDEELSATFFDNNRRMHSDLLMTEDAQQRINKLFST